MNFNIEEFELELWKKALDDVEKEVAQAEKDYAKDPVGVLLEVELEFRDLLNKYQGKQRLTTEFDNKINALNKKQQKAKKMQEQGYDVVKCCDILSDVKCKRNQIYTHYHNLKFRYNLMKERRNG